jgi:hypothetical protein
MEPADAPMYLGRPDTFASIRESIEITASESRKRKNPPGSSSICSRAHNIPYTFIHTGDNDSGPHCIRALGFRPTVIDHLHSNEELRTMCVQPRASQTTSFHAIITAVVLAADGVPTARLST